MSNNNIKVSQSNIGDFLKIGSFNMRGANAPGKMESLCLWGELEDMDIIGVQETNLTKAATRGLFQSDKEGRFTDKHETYILFWECGQNSKKKTAHLGSGVGIAIKKPWAAHVIRRVTFAGRGISIDMSFRTGFRLRVINCYIPSDKIISKEEIEKLDKWIKSESSDANRLLYSVVVMGDFNGVMNPKIDRKSETRKSSNPETDLLQWISVQPLYDTYRTVLPVDRSYTCQETSRIDMIFISHNLARRIWKVEHRSLAPGVLSDHLT